MSYNQCPATSKHTKLFAKCLYFMKKFNLGGHIGRLLEFLKRSKEY